MARLWQELTALWRCLSVAAFLRYWLTAVVLAPALVASRKLVPVDRVMRSRFTVRCARAQLRVDVGAMDRMLPGDTPSFGGIREMYGRNCYLRPFRPMTCGLVVDAGGNRGLFSLLALKALEARRVVYVEPQGQYLPVLHALLDLNGIGRDSVIVLNARCTADLLSRIVREQGSIGFLKMDIEGAEYEALADGGWLRHCDNIAMEIHPGPKAVLYERLVAAGFAVLATDDGGRPAALPAATYLYASRTGGLR